MIQGDSMNPNNVPNHIAIILDGNGRWAKKRGLPRNIGHYNGARNLFTIASHAHKMGVKYLTVYAFSTENWKRPKEEVDYLMTEPKRFLLKNMHNLEKIHYKITFVGRRDRIPQEFKDVIDTLESKTKDNSGLTLQIAFDYGAKNELLTAFSKLENDYTEENLRKHLYVKQDVDVLIRTSGEVRLSNFLLWQVSYAEMFFIKKHWPEFKPKDLDKIIKKYQKRHRRFGGLT
jgi:undecaprenyl diphosphate synthase